MDKIDTMGMGGELQGTLDAGDPRIPPTVRARFGDYSKPVANVIPVLCRRREEWWLFAEHNVLLGVVVRDVPAGG